MSYENIIIIGAGGNLGPSLLSALQASCVFNITILTRASSTSVFPPSIRTIRISDSYPAAELEAAFQNQDAVISLVGSSGCKDQLKFIDAAVKAKVKRFFPSEFGTSLKEKRAVEIFPGFGEKLKVVEYLTSKEKDGLSWTAVVCGPFFDWCLQVGFLSFNLPQKTATIYDSGTARFSTTNLSTIGRSVISILQNPSLSTNQYVYIADFTTTQIEVLAALQKASGENYTVQKSTAKELIDGGNARMQKGDFSGFADLIIGNLYGGEGNDYERDVGLWNERLGVKGTGLEETVMCVVKTGKLAP